MKFFFDTEFIERGPKYPIELISIGIVAEDGRELYEVAVFDETHASDWVKTNVLPHVGDQQRLPLHILAARLIGFIGHDKPEFWAYYCNYDWVVLCQIFGTMMDLPKGWPMFCNDLTVEARRRGNPDFPAQTSTEHNALDDARWTKSTYEWLLQR